MVHHAALNCIRRLFAIVMTSIIFGVPITFVSCIGIFVSIGGFSSFTYYKVQRKKELMLIRRNKKEEIILHNNDDNNNNNDDEMSPV